MKKKVLVLGKNVDGLDRGEYAFKRRGGSNKDFEVLLTVYPTTKSIGKGIYDEVYMDDTIPVRYLEDAQSFIVGDNEITLF